MAKKAPGISELKLSNCRRVSVCVPSLPGWSDSFGQLGIYIRNASQSKTASRTAQKLLHHVERFIPGIACKLSRSGALATWCKNKKSLSRGENTWWVQRLLHLNFGSTRSANLSKPENVSLHIFLYTRSPYARQPCSIEYIMHLGRLRGSLSAHIFVLSARRFLCSLIASCCTSTRIAFSSASSISCIVSSRHLLSGEAVSSRGERAVSSHHCTVATHAYCCSSSSCSSNSINEDISSLS
mmetsp:Transcript_200/g.639  ORF Transcript_200/g.639 Transcript_200/m.639 type:complete len:240 (-) Transcript_200:77-796(-)